MGQVVPTLFSRFSQVGSTEGPPQPSQAYPPGLSAWDPEVGDQEPSTAKHCWTGNYIATFLVAAAKPSDAQSVLRKGMSIDSNFIIKDSYPVVLGFGTFENARSRRYPFFGLNYTEFLAAIPRVFQAGPKYRYPGPYLYPYKLYLNRLLPTIFGRLSGYPKYWERVSLTRAADPPNTYRFNVGKLFTGKSLLQLNFTVSPAFHKVRHFPRFSQIGRLLTPEIVARSLFDVPVQTFFELDILNATVWNVPTATLQLDDQSLFPLLPGTHTWKGIQQETYGAVRLYLPWRLTSADHPTLQLPWAIVQPVGSAKDNQQGMQATG
jgi:hypothetical protein